MALSAFNNWFVSPGIVAKEAERLCTPPRNLAGLHERAGAPDIKDIIDVIANILNWFPYFSSSPEVGKRAKRIAKELNPISQGLSLLSFGKDVFGLPRVWRQYWQKDEGGNLKLCTSVAVLVNSGSEGAMFFDTGKIYPLGEWMKGLSTAFWGSACFLSIVDLYTHQITEIKRLSTTISKIADEDVKAFHKDERGLAYLKVLKNVTTVALGSLILVSLIFASVGAHLLFSPVTLGLSSTWFALHFINYFYANVLASRRDELKEAGKLV